MSAHTRGPWESVLCDNGPAITSNGLTIARLYWRSDADDGTTRANARLIAAAPELLAALEEIVRAGNTNTQALERLAAKVSPGCLREARAAIAKARGGK